VELYKSRCPRTHLTGSAKIVIILKCQVIGAKNLTFFFSILSTHPSDRFAICLDLVQFLIYFSKIKTMDWKKMGFKTEEEYKKFLKEKWENLLQKIKNDPRLLNVFKRLNHK
jgi:hypothetical protein